MNLILLLILTLIYVIIVVGIKDLSNYFDYLNKFIITSCYHLFFSVPLIFTIIYFFDYKFKFTFSIFIILISILSFIIILKLKLKSKIIRLDNRFLITKFSEIIFQQLFILLFVLIFNSYFLNNLLSIFMFSFFFSLIHLFSLFTMPKKRALIYTLLSFVGGFIFYYILVYFENGFYLSFSLHYFFYLCLAFYSYINPKSVFKDFRNKKTF